MSQNIITWRVRFTNQGNFSVYDSPGGVKGFVDTGVQYPINSYFKLSVLTDTVANQINYYFDEELVYTAVAGAAFGQSVEQVVFICNNQQASTDEYFLFDNLVINTVAPDLIFKDSFEAPEKQSF